MKLGLGTAQFGMNYGISNTVGRLGLETAQAVLQAATKHNIRMLDTAPLYQDSEIIIGKSLVSASNHFTIVTKTPKFQANTISQTNAKQITELFQISLNNLKQDTLYGLLFHHPEDLLALGGEYLFAEAKKLQEKGLVKKIGVSVYTPKQVEAILNRYPIDLIQLPINAFDQTFLQQGYLKTLKNLNVEIHARSVFLQGLLLMQVNEMPSYFTDIFPHVATYQACIKQKGLNLVSAALGFVNQIEEIDIVLCGINSVAQLDELVKASQEQINTADFSQFHLENTQFTNPSNWKVA